jgi:hypothetical protein
MKTRRSRKTEFWQKHVARWQAGRLRQAEYCRKHGLTQSQFAYWTRKVGVLKPSSTTFVEIGQDKVQPTGPMTIQIALPGGVAIKLTSEFDTETLKKVIQAVREVLC